MLQRIFKQLIDPMIIILLAAALVSGILAIVEDEGFADVIIILAVVVLNTLLGVIQESKAEKAIDALKEISSPHTKVMRDGVMQIIKSEDLVVGDVIVIEAGDSIPADARIIECASLKIEESALTGESVPVEKQSSPLTLKDGKDVSLGDRTNMIYMGSTAVYGRATAVIVAVGMNTEMGKIADALTTAKENKTPIQIKLSKLSKLLTYIVLGICAFIFAFNFISADVRNLTTALDTFMIAVSLAVAAVPEGLATVVTIDLSIGVTRMSKRNAVIRKLTAVETLGCTQIICSDKTGTLTQNKMTVVDAYGENPLLALSMALCSDAKLGEGNIAVGEPTECALVNYAYTLDINKTEKDKEFERINEAPFDSNRKLMSTIHNVNGVVTQYTKGALDEVLKKCAYYVSENKVLPLTEEKIAEFNAESKKMSQKALRVLASAYKTYDKNPSFSSPNEIENDLIFIGFVGMIDPIREEVKVAIKECKSAGIRPIMITGDHKDTAVAIAKELGIIESEDEAITGAMLSEMSDEEFFEKVEKFSVYARVQPEHKTKIVSAWQKKGKVTAMTGDGVNDAPSIKTADIGIGMGITGTDVTKNVADMVLADDNFATIVDAVGEGRQIYDNIKKAIQFLLSSNLSEVIAIFVATLLGFVVLGPVHILWINLITDTLPALALGLENREPDLMQRKPRDKAEGLFAGGMGFDILYQGLVVAILTLLSYFVGVYVEIGEFTIAQSGVGMTMAFITMSMVEIFHAFNVRSQKKSIFSMKSQNKFLWLSMIVCIVLTIAVIFIPAVNGVFGFETIKFTEYLIATAIGLTIIPIVELVKIVERKVRKD